jgi:hypothetical protein
MRAPNNKRDKKGVSDPGSRDCPCGTLHLGYGMGHGPRSTSVVTTRIAAIVKLVGHGRKLPEKYSCRTSGLVPD